jgi:hypothetical protein
MARRDVWLKTDGTVWRVEARDGDGDSRVWGMNYPDETAARAVVASCSPGVATSGAT